MKILNAFVHIALVAPMFVDAIKVEWYPENEGPSKGAKGTRNLNRGKGGWFNHECKWYKVILYALQPPSVANFPNGGNIDDLGHTFIYNSALFEDDALTIPAGGRYPSGIIVTGNCIRFQQSAPAVGTGGTTLGGGGCDWTYNLHLHGLEGSISVSGELWDSIHSTMAIVGGTGMFIGAEGQIDFFPNYATPPAGADVFTDALYYNVTAVLHFKECYPNHHY